MYNIRTYFYSFSRYWWRSFMFGSMLLLIILSLNIKVRNDIFAQTERSLIGTSTSENNDLDYLQARAEAFTEDGLFERGRELWLELKERSTLAFSSTHWRTKEAELGLKHLEKKQMLNKNSILITSQIDSLLSQSRDNLYLAIRNKDHKYSLLSKDAMNKALSLAKELWGEDDIQYLSIYEEASSQAQIYGDYKNSLEMHKYLITKQLDIRGANNPITERTYSAQYVAYSSIDDIRNAYKVAEKGYQICENISGINSINMVKWLKYLSLSKEINNNEDIQSKLTLLLRAKRIMEDCGDAKSYIYADTVMDLAMCKVSNEEYKEAIDMSNINSSMLEDVMGETVDYALILIKAGTIELFSGDTNAANKTLSKAENILSRYSKDFRYAACIYTYAGCLSESNDCDSAETYLKQSIKIYEDSLVIDYCGLKATLELLISILLDNNKLPEALEYEKYLRKVVDNLYSKYNRDKISLNWIFTEMALANNNYLAAEKYILESNITTNTVKNKKDVSIAEIGILCDIVKMNIYKKKYIESENILFEIENICSKKPGIQFKRKYLEALELYKKILKVMERNNEEIEINKKIIDIKDKYPLLIRKGER
jgi:hypothetical protein